MDDHISSGIQETSDIALRRRIEDHAKDKGGDGGKS